MYRTLRKCWFCCFSEGVLPNLLLFWIAVRFASSFQEVVWLFSNSYLNYNTRIKSWKLAKLLQYDRNYKSIIKPAASITKLWIVHISFSRPNKSLKIVCSSLCSFQNLNSRLIFQSDTPKCFWLPHYVFTLERQLNVVYFNLFPLVNPLKEHFNCIK